MQFDFNFYSSILLIFFVHGLVYSVLLAKRGFITNNNSSKWLSAFLILCIFYISSWMLGFAGWYDHQPYRDIMFYTPLQLLYFIGPVIYFYVKSLLNPAFSFGKKQWLHFIPGIIFLLFCLVVVITDKLVLKKYYFLVNGQDPEFDIWYQFTGFASMLYYFLITLKYYKLYKKIIVQTVSYADVVIFKWVQHFLYAFLAMIFFKVLFYIGSFIPFFANLNYEGPWWEFLVFAILFYYIAVSGYANAVVTKVPYKLHFLPHKIMASLPIVYPTVQNQVQPIPEAEYIEVEEANTITTDNTLINEWKPKIEALLQKQKLHENPELTLTQLAKQLNTNASIISKVINQGFGLNFNDFINKYRIEAVKEKLMAGEQKTQTLLGIAYDCGFNSKATFNRSFKKFTGTTPKDFFINTSA